MTLLTPGPCLSIASIRARYFSAIECAVYMPDFMPSCKSAMVFSSNSNEGTSTRCVPCEFSRATAKADLVKGAAAAVAPPIRLSCRNLLRSGRAGFDLSVPSCPGFNFPEARYLCLPASVFLIVCSPRFPSLGSAPDSTPNLFSATLKSCSVRGLRPGTSSGIRFPAAYASVTIPGSGVPP